MGATELYRTIAAISRSWPPALVRQVASQLEAGYSLDSINRGLLAADKKASFAFLQTALTAYPQINNAGVALALLVALENHEQTEKSAPELVWTGPSSQRDQWRRTDAALLEVIQSAKSSLWLVTFAVQGGQILSNALCAAASRGVTIRFVCESHKSKINGDALAKVRAILPETAIIYEWPEAMRDRNEDNNFGTLHAKIAVADNKLALLSSANLTDCALDFNIECGVLLHDNDAAKIASKLEKLVSAGIWKAVS